MSGLLGVSHPFAPKRPIPHVLSAQISMLPEGQRRVAEALVNGPVAKTYAQVAAERGLCVGTVYRYLARIRSRRSGVYAALMAERRRQLADRHREAAARAAEHNRAWHRKRANRRYYYRFGRWPWERRR